MRKASRKLLEGKAKDLTQWSERKGGEKSEEERRFTSETQRTQRKATVTEKHRQRLGGLVRKTRDEPAATGSKAAAVTGPGLLGLRRPRAGLGRGRCRCGGLPCRGRLGAGVAWRVRGCC